MHAPRLRSALRGPWPLFATLFLLLLAGHLDRQVVVSMFPVLRATWSLSDAELGALVSIVSLVVACASIPLSLAADRVGHVRAIAVMVVAWCTATLACAFAPGYASLLAFRALIGVGQAAFGAVSAALLATRFPAAMRSTILGTFLAAGLIGNAFGVYLGGVLTAYWGWRAAFAVAALPGFVLVALLLGIEARRAPPAPAAPSAAPEPWAAHLRSLARSRTVLLACVASGLQLLTVAMLASWLTTYLVREAGYGLERASGFAAAVLLVAVGGAMGWSALGDRLAARDPAARLRLAAWIAVATGVTTIAAFRVLSPGIAQSAALVVVGALMTGHLGLAAAAVFEGVHPSIRATATGVLAFTHNILGLALGPVLVGALSDAHGLSFAMAVVPVASLLAASGFALAARSLGRAPRPATAATGPARQAQPPRASAP